MSGATYPVETIAKLLMVSTRRVQQLTKQGIIPRSERGRYDLAPAVQGYIKFLQDRMAGNASQVDDLDYHKEKTRKIKYEADIAELDAAKKRGTLIEVATVERHAQTVMLEVRTRLLAVADRVTPRVVGETSERTVKAAISDEIEQALLALAETSEQLDEADDEPDAATSDEDDDGDE